MDPNYKFDPYYLKLTESEINSIKHEEQYIYNLKKKSKPAQARRKIYEKVEYTEFEQQGIKNLKEAFEQNNVNPKAQPMVLPSNWRESDWLKMCYTARFEIKKCLEKMRQHIEWRNDESNFKIDQTSLELFKKGFFYQIGRDKDLRPVLYMDATKISMKDGKDNITKAISVYLNGIKKYMFHDYAIENWVVILDLHGMGLTSVPTKALGAIIGHMSTNFCATLERMYILNPSTAISFLWSTVTAFMDEETADKIKMLKKKEFSQIQTQIPNIRYIQQQHGGELLDQKDNYWPPINVYDVKKPVLAQETTKIQQNGNLENVKQIEPQNHQEEVVVLQNGLQNQIVEVSSGNQNHLKEISYGNQNQNQNAEVQNNPTSNDQQKQNKNLINEGPLITVGEVEDKLIVDFTDHKPKKYTPFTEETYEQMLAHVKNVEEQQKKNQTIANQETQNIEAIQNGSQQNSEFSKLHDNQNAQNAGCGECTIF